MPLSPQQQSVRQAQRRQAVLRHAAEITGNVALTCRYYGISRKTFYKWQRRHQTAGLDGLRDHSSKPITALTPPTPASSAKSPACAAITISGR